MSDGLNRVILLGNLGADPEIRYAAGGGAVLSLRIATNESYLDRNKERQERTEWHNVVVFGARAEGLHKILTKGSGVLIEGGLRTSSYEKDGVTRYKTEVVAREICFAGKRSFTPGDAEGAATAPPQAPSRAPVKAPRSAPARTELLPMEDIPF